MIILKYPLREAEEQTVMLPAGAVPLSVQSQNGIPVLWAMVDTSKEKEPRKIFIVGTGNEVKPPFLVYISTVQMASGFVWHFFIHP